MLRLILVPVLALILFVGHVHAQTPYFWNSAASGNWNVGGNWNPAAIPGAADSALINATGSNYTVTLSDTQSINNLTINSANATFAETGTLNLGGTLTLSSGSYQIVSTNVVDANGPFSINGGQIVSTGGIRLSTTGGGYLNNVTLGNATNPDVVAIDNNSRNWTFIGSTDFQPGYVPTIGINGQLVFWTSRVLNTGYNLNGGALVTGVGYGNALTLKTGNVITASGPNNYISTSTGDWKINGTVITSDTGSTNISFSGGTPNQINIGATGSVIAGTSSGNASITFTFGGAASLRVDGTIRANSGGTITIFGGSQGSQVFSSSSKLIADGGTIILYQNNFNINGTLTMTNGGIISMPNGTTNYTNQGTITISSTGSGSPSTMTVGSTPDSTFTNPGTLAVSVGGIAQVGSTGNPGSLNSSGSVSNNGTINANVTVSSGSISGNGSISGSVNVNPNGILLPGNSPGKMTLQNGLTLSGQYGWELGSNTEAGPGTNFDQIAVTAGNVVINSTASLKLTLPAGGTSDPFWASNHSWEILDNSGIGTTNAAFDPSQIIGGAQPNGVFSTSLVGNDVFLNWTFVAVPEPSTWAMLAFTGIAAAWAYRWRRISLRKQLEASV